MRAGIAFRHWQTNFVGFGILSSTPGNTCSARHLDRNVDILVGQQASFRSTPGYPRWGLAPIDMAWQGKSVSEVWPADERSAAQCGRNLELLHERVANDDLVAWGWHPGLGRDPVPGTQQQALGELIRAWIDSGAECP
jgi:hypothetical protein